MSKTYLISDHHFRHRSILKFEGDNRQGTTVAEHDEWLIEQHNSTVKKRDHVWFLGDVYFGNDGQDLEALMQTLNGTHHLVLGNHDLLPPIHYARAFSTVHGVKNYKRRAFTHVPIHEQAFERWEYNFHGHIHSLDSPTDRHINVCVEKCAGIPRTLEQWLENH